MELKLSRNKDNEGKKRPVCVCGTEMTFVHYQGYYDEREYWVCQNPECNVDEQLKPDIESRGAYS